MLDFDESKYPPDCTYGEQRDGRFETYAPDVHKVLLIHKVSPKNVWTIVEDEGDLIICAGYCLVNRMQYYVSSTEWENENEVYMWSKCSLSNDSY